MPFTAEDRDVQPIISSPLKYDAPETLEQLQTFHAVTVLNGVTEVQV